MDNFLRIPDCFIRFPARNEILLLSDREADQILQLFQKRDSRVRDKYFFGHCSFEGDLYKNPLLRYSTMNTSNISDEDACTIKLFNGVCMYPGSQSEALKGMLSCVEKLDSSNKLNTVQISGDTLYLVTARAKNTDYDRSDLETICNNIACEFEQQDKN